MYCQDYNLIFIEKTYSNILVKMRPSEWFSNLFLLLLSQFFLKPFVINRFKQYILDRRELLP